MASGNDDAEIARLRAMTDGEFCAYVAAQRPDWDNDVAKLNLVAQMEMVEKALFGATLDDIMNFTGLSRLPTGEEVDAGRIGMWGQVAEAFFALRIDPASG
jgi:hypothetical protein